MNFIPSAHRARSSAFETYVAAVDDLLACPEVQQEVGPTAGRLALMNQDAFLPNITYGQISTPPAFLDTDRIALVPRLPGEGEQLVLTPSALMPTPSSRQRFINRLLVQGYAPSEGEDFAAEVAAESADTAVPDVPDSLAITLYDSRYHFESGSQLTSRPHVFTDFPPEVDCYIDQGSTVFHELVHAEDAETAAGIPQDEKTSDIAMELHAYHRQAQVLTAMGVDRTRYHPVSSVWTAYAVENVRRRHNGPEEPYAVTPPIVEELKRLGAVFAF